MGPAQRILREPRLSHSNSFSGAIHVLSIGQQRKPIHKGISISRGSTAGFGASPTARAAGASLQALLRGTCRARLYALRREARAVRTSLRALQRHVVADPILQEKQPPQRQENPDP